MAGWWDAPGLMARVRGVAEGVAGGAGVGTGVLDQLTGLLAEPGEVVQAGTALVTLLDLHKVYLRGFVPEGEIGKVRVGQLARVFLDSDPTQPIPAIVQRIDPETTFTPENTYFRDERVKQVVGIKLLLKGAFGFAKPGMPADGEVLIRGEEWPESRRTK